MHTFTYVLLWLMVAMVPTEEWLPTQFGSIVRLFGFVAITCALLAVLFRVRIRPLPSLIFLMATYVLWAIASMAWTVDFETTLGVLDTYVALGLFFWMIWEFAPTHSRHMGLMRAYLVGCTVLLGALYVSYVFGVGTIVVSERTARYSGAGMNPNRLAFLLALGVPLAVYLATLPSTGMRLFRFAYWAYIPFAGLGVFLTGSRGGAATLVAGVVLTFLMSQRSGWQAKLVLLLAILFGGMLVIRFVPSELIERYQQGTEAGTLAKRQGYWADGFRCLQRYPIGGAGAGTFRIAASGTPDNPGNVAHNAFVDVMAELGLVGSLLQVTCLLTLLYFAMQLPRSERSLWLVALLVWLTASMGSSIALNKATWLLFSLIMGQAAIWYQASRSSVRPASMPFQMRPVRGTNHG